MPTAYTAVPTATQAPSPQPGPDVLPIFNLVADGDPRNAASLEQIGKVSADFIGWLTAPTARSGNWTESTLNYRNARGQIVSAVDHFGFPRGRFVRWVENWKESLGYACGGVTGRQVKAWRQVITSSGGAIDAPGPGVGGVGGNPFGPVRAIRLSTDTGSSAVGQFVEHFIAEDSTDGYLDDDTVISVDFDFVATDITHQSIQVGFASSGLDIDLTNAVFFLSDGSGPDWQCITKASPGSTGASSGIVIAANTIYRFRIVAIGANRGDDSTRRILFFINGSLVGNITTTIPTGAGNSYAPFVRGTTILSGGSLPSMSIGTVAYSQTTAPAGVF